MSIQYSDTSTYRGILQLIERELGFDLATISGNTTKKAQFTADINLAWDRYLHLAFSASGEWQYDDTNHTDYPIIKTNLVASQQSYTFSTDENSNLILDIFKVAILPSATSTLYEEIYPIDQQTKGQAPDLVSETTATGVPRYYDKTANGIFLWPTPSYSSTSGLKLYINREPSYFTTSDTTKKPGCPGLHHMYFVLKPAHDYARRNSLAIEPALRAEVLKMEAAIEEYFGNRDRDVRKTITPKITQYM